MSEAPDRASLSAHWSDRLADRAVFVLLVLTALGCAAGVLRAVAIVPLHVSLDPDEGWNAYLAAAAVSGHSLYPGPASYFVNNYPPLSFYLVGALGSVVGDNIFAGRSVSLVAFLFVCGAIVRIVFTAERRWQAALFAALVFAILLLLGSDYVGMNDPQLLGHAFGMAGLMLILHDRRSLRAICVAALLFVVAGFIKHDLFVLPLAVAIWLLWQDRRGGWRFTVAGAAIVLVALVAFRLVSGFDLLARLASARIYSWTLLQTNVEAWVGMAGGAALVAGWIVRAGWREKWIGFCAVYAAIGVVAGAVFLGGAGVDVNAMFDADIALAFLAGAALARLSRSRSAWSGWAKLAVVTTCLLPPVLFAFAQSDNSWESLSFWFEPLGDDAKEAGSDIAFLRSHPGPALCEQLALCYWAGKSAEVDVFNLGQQLRTQARSARPFMRQIEQHRYSTVSFDTLSPFPFPADVARAFTNSYRVDHEDDEGVFLVPK